MRARLPVLLLFLLALVLRIGVAGYRDLDRPPIKDEIAYALLAESLARGEGFKLEVHRDLEGETVRIVRRSLRPPLWPLLLSGVFNAGGGLAAGRLLACLLGALLVLPLLGLARKVLPERPALLAAGLLAVWPSHVWISGELLTEPLYMLLLTAGSLAVVRGRDLTGGIAVGAAVLTRPTALLLLPFLVLFRLTDRGGSRTGYRRLTGIAVLVLPVLLLPLPWALRNAEIHGRPLLTTNLGVTFLGGNSDRSLSDRWPGRWHRPEEVLDDPPPLGYYGWPELTEAEVDRRFLREGLSFVTGSPGRWLELTGHKLVRFFDPDQHSDKADRRTKTLLGWASFGLLLPFVLLGLPDALFRWRVLLPLLGLVVAHLAVSLVFHADVRMRLPAIPGFLVLGVIGGRNLVLRVKRVVAGAPNERRR